MHTHGPILLAGGIADIDLIAAYLRHLPQATRAGLLGTVFIEVESHREVGILDAPAGVGVHWLVREDAEQVGDRSEQGGDEPGLPLVRAVRLWAQEWIVEDGDQSLQPQLMWIGCAGTPIVERMCVHLLNEHEDLHLHHADLI